MVADRAKIERLEKDLEDARRELLKEDGERYRILMRDIGKDEKDRILRGLRTRVKGSFLRLEAPDQRPGGTGGDLSCSICGKSGLTKRGLGLHMVRLHKSEMERQEEEAA